MPQKTMVQKFRKKTLTLKDTGLVGSLVAPTADIESTILDISVPRGERVYVKHGAEMKLFLRVKETFTGDAANKAFTMATDLVHSPNFDEKLLSADREGDAYAFVTDVSTPAYVIDYTTNILTFDVAPPAAADNVVIYHLFKPAVIRVKGANANKEKFNPLFTQALEGFHENNQYKENTKQKIKNSYIAQPQEHILVTYKGTAVFSTDEKAQNHFELDVEMEDVVQPRQ